MNKKVCDQCEDPMNCLSAGGCFIETVKAKYTGNLSEDLSEFNTNWSGLNPAEQDIDKTFGNKEWLDRNGFDVVN